MVECVPFPSNSPPLMVVLFQFSITTTSSLASLLFTNLPLLIVVIPPSSVFTVINPLRIIRH